LEKWNQLYVPACAILETDAPCLISQDFLNVVTVIELIVKTWGDIDLAGGITILNHNNVIRLEECTPVTKTKDQKKCEMLDS
jgi:hypothetical protein